MLALVVGADILSVDFPCIGRDYFREGAYWHRSDLFGFYWDGKESEVFP
jgi:hypothetical protein